MTAEIQGGAVSKENLQREKKQAEYRLRMVEKIALYREQKLKKEFERIEKDLYDQESAQQQQIARERKRQYYFEMQKKKLYEYRTLQQLG